MTTYLEIYLSVLDQLGILPEDAFSDTGASEFILDDPDEDSIMPSDPAYQPLAIFGHILDAEAEAISTKLTTMGDGRKAGEWLQNAGFTTLLIISQNGAVLPSRNGDLNAVEVTQNHDTPDDIVWEVAEPAAQSFVQNYNEFAKRNGLAEMGVFDALYALDKDATRIWFTGEACRVTYPGYVRRAAPVTMEELLVVLKEPCPAPAEIISAVKDIAIGAAMPREGDMIGAANYFTNRGRATLRGEQIKAMPRPAVITAQKADG